jgi:hypothetical protein
MFVDDYALVSEISRISMDVLDGKSGIKNAPSNEMVSLL